MSNKSKAKLAGILAMAGAMGGGTDFNEPIPFTASPMLDSPLGQYPKSDSGRPKYKLTNKQRKARAKNKRARKARRLHRK